MITGKTATFCPTVRSITPSPSSTIVPENSWPRCSHMVVRMSVQAKHQCLRRTNPGWKNLLGQNMRLERPISGANKVLMQVFVNRLVNACLQQQSMVMTEYLPDPQIPAHAFLTLTQPGRISGSGISSTRMSLFPCHRRARILTNKKS